MTFEEIAVRNALEAHADSALRPGATAADMREAMKAVAREAYRTAIGDAALCIDEVWNDLGGDLLQEAREEVLRLPERDPDARDDDGPGSEPVLPFHGSTLAELPF